MTSLLHRPHSATAICESRSTITTCNRNATSDLIDKSSDPSRTLFQIYRSLLAEAERTYAPSRAQSFRHDLAWSYFNLAEARFFLAVQKETAAFTAEGGVKHAIEAAGTSLIRAGETSPPSSKRPTTVSCNDASVVTTLLIMAAAVKMFHNGFARLAGGLPQCLYAQWQSGQGTPVARILRTAETVDRIAVGGGRALLLHRYRKTLDSYNILSC